MEHRGNEKDGGKCLMNDNFNKQREEKLNKQEERFKNIFEQVPWGIALIGSLTGHIQEVNQKFADITGRTIAELYTLEWMSIMHPDDMEENMDKMLLLNTGKINGFNMNKRCLHPDGSIIWINMTISSINENDKENLHHLCMIEDITKQKHSAKVLMENGERFKTFTQTSMEGFWVVDIYGRIMEVNDAYCRMSGYSKNALLSMRITDLETDKFTDQTRAYIENIKVTGWGRFERRQRKADGTIYKAQFSVIFLEEKRVFLCFINDVTDREQAEEEKENIENELKERVQELAFQNEEKAQRAAELIIANKELAFQNEEKADRAAELIIADKELTFQNEEKADRAAELIIANKELAFQNEEKDKRAEELIIANEASQLKSAFLSNMSHELRTPLNAIVGFSELALKTSLNQKQRNYLSKIKVSSHILLGLISDILDLSKIEAGKLELEITTFNLEEVIQKAANQVSAKSQEKGLALMVIIDKDVPISLNGDSLRLGQVLLNLASNAVKFTDEGKVIIRVELLGNEGRSALLQFSVKDTGIGLTEQQIKKLFQPFTQADTSTTRKYGGTGLGLSISQKLVNLMNGDIWVESELGRGSTFFFTTKINIADKKRLLHYRNSFENDTDYLPQLRGTRVLLVEDNEINREVAQEILREAGLIVTIASNGREAVDKVRSNAYDIVLIDIQMPIMDGYDATREIRKDPVYAELPIIAMTANALLSDQEKCLQSGMNDHVAKPIDTNQLFQKIVYWINREQVIIQKEAKVGTIDVEAGLSRLGRNKKLYFKLLRLFCKNHKHAVKEIRHALDNGDLKEAEMMVHIIKGEAGNLSVQEVYLKASALEAEFMVNRFDDVELMLEQLKQALEQTFTSISLMEKDIEDIQSSSPSGADISLLKPILYKLEKLLQDNNMDALECVEEIEIEVKNFAFAEKISELKDYVDQYDFEDALGILNEIFYRIEEERNMKKIESSFIKKILIVDDSPEAIEVLKNALPKHYKRQVALSGEKAIKLLETSEELPDLILLDVMMPGMDGYEVCRHLKKDDRFKEIPVIYLSALTDTKDKVKAFEQGGVDYIEKPFQIEEVRARVDTHLKLSYFQRELEDNNNNLKIMVEEKVEEISESQIATIFAMAKLTESRDKDTGDHLKRIQIFCGLIAEKLSLHPKYKNKINRDFIDILQKASPLHDIGKVGVRDVILLKPGKLTTDEFEEMKLHTSIGANTLEEVYQKYPGNNFVKIGIEIAESHHEKWDGSGYPKGLCGENIPLSARIMALADVYDALRSKRVYKEAYSNEETREIIIQGSGKHFDSLIVEAFLEVEEEFDKVYEALRA